MKSNNRSLLGIYTVGIALLFLAGFLLLVIFGAQSYRNTAAVQNTNMQDRALTAFLQAAVKSADREDSVSIEESADGQVLVLADGSTGYGIRIYKHEDILMEEYSKLSRPVSPENAQQIAKTHRFELTQKGNGTLSVYTDEGRVLIHLRSEESGIQ